MKRLLLVPALVLLAACGGQDVPAAGPPASGPGGSAAGACLVGDPDCQDTGGEVGAAPPTSSDAVPGEAVPFDADGAPAFVTDRAPLPSCGEYGIGPRPLPQAVHDCFALAVGTAEGAEYVVADPTTEGDLVVHYYRALPGGGVEVLVDATRDAFGSQDWTQVACTGYDAARGTATGCPPDGSGEV